MFRFFLNENRTRSFDNLRVIRLPFLTEHLSLFLLRNPFFQFLNFFPTLEAIIIGQGLFLFLLFLLLLEERSLFDPVLFPFFIPRGQFSPLPF